MADKVPFVFNVQKGTSFYSLPLLLYAGSPMYHFILPETHPLGVCLVQEEKKTVVIEFHSNDSPHEFGRELGLVYEGTVGVLDWAHEFKFATNSVRRSVEAEEKTLHWTQVLSVLQKLTVPAHELNSSTYLTHSGSTTRASVLRP